jgi:hypothetical protein
VPPELKLRDPAAPGVATHEPTKIGRTARFVVTIDDDTVIVSTILALKVGGWRRANDN